MPRWPALMYVLALAGCHVVFGFDGEIAERSDGGADGAVGDAEPDGPTCIVEACPFDDDLHDEDGDCTPDACDPCPHLARDEDDVDGDSDGVGDGCDESNEYFSGAVFMSFEALEGFSTVDASVAGGALHLTTTNQDPTFAYHNIPSEPPYRVMTRMLLSDTLTFGGLAIGLPEETEPPTYGYAVVLGRTSAQVTLAIHAIDDGDLVPMPAAVTSFNASGDLFEIDVMVHVTKIEAIATDLVTNTRSEQITSFGSVTNADERDGVILAPGQVAMFESWFRSQRQTSR